LSIGAFRFDYFAMFSESTRWNVKVDPARRFVFPLNAIGDVVIRYDLPFTKTEFSSSSPPPPNSLLTKPAADEFAGITISPSTCTASLIDAVNPVPFAAVLGLTASSSFTVIGVITGRVILPLRGFAASTLRLDEIRAATAITKQLLRRNLISTAPPPRASPPKVLDGRPGKIHPIISFNFFATAFRL
jgi:hypothetical protein